jgi:hypothetical protein
MPIFFRYQTLAVSFCLISASGAYAASTFTAKCVGEIHGLKKPEEEFKTSKGAQNWCKVYHEGEGHSCSSWES